MFNNQSNVNILSHAANDVKTPWSIAFRQETHADTKKWHASGKTKLNK